MTATDKRLMVKVAKKLRHRTRRYIRCQWIGEMPELMFVAYQEEMFEMMCRSLGVPQRIFMGVDTRPMIPPIIQTILLAPVG